MQFTLTSNINKGLGHESKADIEEDADRLKIALRGLQKAAYQCASGAHWYTVDGYHLEHKSLIRRINEEENQFKYLPYVQPPNDSVEEILASLLSPLSS
ncbi:hypothetical protein GE061_018214 [Apolygus lucorum]|uniref:Uncharacterized protein n=1 Tax=Apolygus lucorum TaxID=248454 RepID=A0A8S9XD98_APOLU|nr:hypothetical protein GE061_018214 [Apolygus lucorum]